MKGAARNIVFGNGDEQHGDIDDGGAEVRPVLARAACPAPRRRPSLSFKRLSRPARHRAVVRKQQRGTMARDVAAVAPSAPSPLPALTSCCDHRRGIV